MSDIEIRPLADTPEHSDTIARWIYEAFPHEFVEQTFDGWRESFRPRPNDGAPGATSGRVTLVALVDGAAIATASLDDEDLPSRPDLSPWLASVYVLPSFRRDGVGSALTRCIEREAVNRGNDTLFLHTTDREAFYKRRGWTLVERTRCWDRNVFVMSRQLAKPW